MTKLNNFTTKVALDMMLDIEGNYNIDTANVEINWDLGIDSRSWGLKDIGISVPEQTITVFVTKWTDDVDEEVEMSFDLKDVTIERMESEFFSLAPQSLEFYKGKWKLVF